MSKLPMRLTSITVPLCALAVISCGRAAETVDPQDRLCRGRGAFGAVVTGTPEPVEVCLPDDADGGSEVGTIYTGSDGRYVVTASVESDGVVYEIKLSFVTRATVPQNLDITTVMATAYSNKRWAWFHYREFKNGAYEYVSSDARGVIRLTLSDENVAAGTFHSVEIDLIDSNTSAAAGKRVISEAFFAVTPDP